MGWDDDEADHDVFVYELPHYPREFTADQRLSAYWHMIRCRRKPATTDDWHKILHAAESSAQTRELIVAGVKAEHAERPAHPEAQRRTLSGPDELRIAEARANLERAERDELGWRKVREHAPAPAETEVDDTEGRG